MKQMENKISFWGVELNEEEIRNHRISYSTMAKQFDGVLCTKITEIDPYIFDNVESGDFEYYEYDGDEITEDEIKDKIEALEEAKENLGNQVQEDEEDDSIEKQIEELDEQIYELENLDPIQREIYQYYIIDDNALWYLRKANELVFYSDVLDCYIWGVTHCGTSWRYVMTSLKINDDFTSLED